MQSDGSVLPSFMLTRASDSQSSWSSRIVNDSKIHEGVVVAVYDPRDENNYSKKVYEYDVEAYVSEGIEMQTTVTYPRCRMQTTFGGLTDRYIWTPRVQVKNKDGSIKEPGSKVLIECINGISRYGVIVGAVEPETIDEQPQDFKNLPRLGWQFNGVDVVIDKNGALVMTRKGPTNAEGKATQKDSDGIGASVTLDKDGQVIVQTGDGKQVVTMNFKDGTISIKADKGVKVEVDGGKFETDASNGVQLGGSSEHLILGDTYVNAEKAFVSALGAFANQMLAIATTLSTAVIDPSVAPAGAQLQAAVQLLGPAINVFKAHLETKDVLSKKNTTE